MCSVHKVQLYRHLVNLDKKVNDIYYIVVLSSNIMNFARVLNLTVNSGPKSVTDIAMRSHAKPFILA